MKIHVFGCEELWLQVWINGALQTHALDVKYKQRERERERGGGCMASHIIIDAGKMQQTEKHSPICFSNNKNDMDGGKMRRRQPNWIKGISTTVVSSPMIKVATLWKTKWNKQKKGGGDRQRFPFWITTFSASSLFSSVFCVSVACTWRRFCKNRCTSYSLSWVLLATTFSYFCDILILSLVITRCLC